MSGRGDNLTDVIRKELASLFAPVAGKTPPPVDLNLPANVTYCNIEPACPVNEVAVHAPEPLTREGLGDMAVSEFASSYPMVSLETPTHMVSCDMDPVACNTPVFHPEDADVHSVNFEGMGQRQSHGIALPHWSTITHPVSTRRPQVNVFSIKPGHFNIRQKSHQASAIKSTVRDMMSGLWGMPISRTPIPPHRFSKEMKERFRKTLAEKAGVSSTSIQIRVVFDRMNMVLFENIEQDKQGRLMCYPKSRYLGKNWHHHHHEADRIPMYLVFGIIIGTSQSVNALVSGIDPDLPAESPAP